MSKANVLASLATDVNELSSLADQISEIEGAIEQANTNFHAIQSLPEIPEIPEIPPPVLSFRNKIINGNFAIWQRGTTSISPHSGYQTADRWYLGANIGNSRNDDSPAEFQYSLDISGSVADSNGYALLFHRIESKNIISSIGKKLTLSAYVRNIGTSTANVSAEIYYPNSTDNWAAQSVVGGLTTQAITNEWSRIVFPSFDVPADANKGLEVRIFRHDANNDQQWRITGVQLEEGEVATPFEQRPYGLELSLCQRYFEICYFNVHAYVQGNTYQSGGTVFWHPKRTTPTATYTGIRAGGGNNYTGTNGGNISMINNSSALLAAQGAASGVSSLYGAKWEISAEL